MGGSRRDGRLGAPEGPGGGAAAGAPCQGGGGKTNDGEGDRAHDGAIERDGHLRKGGGRSRRESEGVGRSRRESEGVGEVALTRGSASDGAGEAIRSNRKQSEAIRSTHPWFGFGRGWSGRWRERRRRHRRHLLSARAKPREAVEPCKRLESHQQQSAAISRNPPREAVEGARGVVEGVPKGCLGGAQGVFKRCSRGAQGVLKGCSQSSAGWAKAP